MEEKVMEQIHNLDKKSLKRYKKWIKAKRKKYVKYFKEWCPFGGDYLYNPIKMIIKDMAEYYKNGDNVWTTPMRIDENGNLVEKDDRYDTLTEALMLLDLAELDEEFGEYESSQQQFKKAFGYIAEHIKEWLD
jgi:hypothetical protein